MAKRIVVNVGVTETRLAVQDGNQLTELYIERARRRSIVGNIYKGVVTNVLPGMQAAFVDIGLHKDAFLYGGDYTANLTDEGDEAFLEIHARTQQERRNVLGVLRERIRKPIARALGEVIGGNRRKPHDRGHVVRIEAEALLIELRGLVVLVRLAKQIPPTRPHGRILGELLDGGPEVGVRALPVTERTRGLRFDPRVLVARDERRVTARGRLAAVGERVTSR